MLLHYDRDLHSVYKKMFKVISHDAGLKSFPPLSDGLINDGLTVCQPDAVSTHQHCICTSDTPGAEDSARSCNRLILSLGCWAARGLMTRTSCTVLHPSTVNVATVKYMMMAMIIIVITMRKCSCGDNTSV